MRIGFASVVAGIFLAVSTSASAVTLSIAEDTRISGGMINPIVGPGLAPDVIDNQFNMDAPDDLNAAFENAGAFTGPFGATETILVFGLLVDGEDPVVGAFTSPFTVTLNATEAFAGSGAQGRFEIRSGGTGGTLVSSTLFGVGESNLAIFDSSTLGDGTGLFEFRVVGKGLNEVDQSLNYDYTIAGGIGTSIANAVPLPASVLLLVGGLAVMGFGARRARRTG